LEVERTESGDRMDKRVQTGQWGVMRERNKGWPPGFWQKNWMGSDVIYWQDIVCDSNEISVNIRHFCRDVS
jgi:hypothetical protein